ncbi:MAG TPA: hypothetical protein DCQ04_16420 [Actinobacteria bacterium]|nr:hypothetical protein [Actinomycetota bacterium]
MDSPRIDFSPPDFAALAAAEAATIAAVGQDPEAAIAQLRKSARGTRALGDLLRFLEAGGDGLDTPNRAAVLGLLGMVWADKGGMAAREALRAACAPVPQRRLSQPDPGEP